MAHAANSGKQQMSNPVLNARMVKHLRCSLQIITTKEYCSKVNGNANSMGHMPQLSCTHLVTRRHARLELESGLTHKNARDFMIRGRLPNSISGSDG